MEYTNIINIARFCTDDGPGIRTTVFLKGCPLRCAWCHNPESQSSTPEILWDQNICTHCGRCAGICAKGAHSFRKGQHWFDPDLCTGCGLCTEICQAGALELIGKRVSTEEVFEEVERDLVFYTASGGGMTVSGGEPLMHPAFTTQLLKRCKDVGIHTAIETSGFATPSAWTQVLPYCDLVLFDIKETDDARHRAYTGVPLGPILHSLRQLDNAGVKTILRAPIIPGRNDREVHLLALRQLRDSLRHCQGLQIMPYHSMGAYKYQKLQRSYLCEEIQEPDEETIDKWKKYAE